MSVALRVRCISGCASVPKAESSSCIFRAQDNIFEWHFVVRGAADSEFEVRGLLGTTGQSNKVPAGLQHLCLVRNFEHRKGALRQGGLYHGRILLPPEYPFKPPSFLMLTPNGRFETGQKVRSLTCNLPAHI